MGNMLRSGKKLLSRQKTLFLSLGLSFLIAGTACGPKTNSFQMKDDEAFALPGGDIDPTIFDRAEAPPKKTTPVRNTNVEPQRNEQVPAPRAAPTNVVESLEAGPYPADRDESQLDRIRTRVTPGGLIDKEGRPRRDYSERLKKRFGERLNQPLTKDKVSAGMLTKSQKIMRELQRAVDRTNGIKESPLMFMDTAAAVESSKKFESTGDITKAGAWTIATQGTAKRHGFANVPCAEFMSEVIRQAYARAGYSLDEDFNSKNGNPLIWKETASVTGLSKALFKAGWIPYSAYQFRAPVGAIMFHTLGLSPSHTYAAAGIDGLLIVDNGAPKGRDLRNTKAKTLNLMFNTGFFMLPPGITPYRWTDAGIPMS